jgi:hypothetical protein
MPNNLTIFKDNFVVKLRTSVPDNLTRYQQDDVWVSQLDTRNLREMETKVELKSKLELQDPDKGDLKDLENAVRVHKALSHLSPLQARDARVWTYLSHVTLWPYMRRRWKVEKHIKDVGKAERYVLAHYFVAQKQSRALLRSGISRLWWTAHLTHDEKRINPYELTAVLFKTLDISQTILERNMGRAPAVLAGFLEFLLRNRDLLLTGGDANRIRIRRLAMYLNLYGGVSVLDCLNESEIIKLLGAELDQIMSSEQELVAP